MRKIAEKKPEYSRLCRYRTLWHHNVFTINNVCLYSVCELRYTSQIVTHKLTHRNIRHIRMYCEIVSHCTNKTFVLHFLWMNHSMNMNNNYEKKNVSIGTYRWKTSQRNCWFGRLDWKVIFSVELCRYLLLLKKWAK